MADKKTKKRRIKGELFWKLADAREKSEEALEALREAARNKARELQLYPDQVDFVTGRVVDQIDGSKVIKRLDFEVLEWYQGELNKFNEIQKRWRSAQRVAAKACKLPADLIDPKTGEIHDEDVEFVDPLVMEDDVPKNGNLD